MVEFPRCGEVQPVGRLKLQNNSRRRQNFRLVFYKRPKPRGKIWREGVQPFLPGVETKLFETPTIGHCLCKAVIFEFSGTPHWTLFCHCESCRRATSAPITAWISVPRHALRYVHGTPRYHSSSPKVRRGFCGTCGTAISYENEAIPDEVHLCAMTLADQSRVLPSAHVFVEEQVSWLEIADQLPRYAKTRRGAEPVRFGPRINPD